MNNSSQARELESIADSELQTLKDEYAVARLYAVSVATVRRWRLLGQGPKYIKIGASVRYKQDDLVSWLESRPTGGEHVGKGLGR